MGGIVGSALEIGGGCRPTAFGGRRVGRGPTEPKLGKRPRRRTFADAALACLGLTRRVLTDPLRPGRGGGQAMDASEIGRLEGWSLSFDDHAFLANLPIGARLAAAAQLKFLDCFGCFPSTWAQIGDDAVAYLAEQLGADTASGARPELDGRTARRHRERILAHLGLRRMSSADRVALDAWLADTLCPAGGSLEAMVAAVFARCRERRLQPSARAEVERAVRRARRAFRERLLAGITAALTPEAAARIEAALGEPDGPTGFHARQPRCRPGHARQRAGRARAAGLHPRPGAAARLPCRGGPTMGRDARAPCCRRDRIGDAPPRARAPARADGAVVDGARGPARVWRGRPARRDGAPALDALAPQGGGPPRPRDRARAWAEERLLAEIAEASIDRP